MSDTYTALEELARRHEEEHKRFLEIAEKHPRLSFNTTGADEKVSIDTASYAEAHKIATHVLRSWLGARKSIILSSVEQARDEIEERGRAGPFSRDFADQLVEHLGNDDHFVVDSTTLSSYFDIIRG